MSCSRQDFIQYWVSSHHLRHTDAFQSGWLTTTNTPWSSSVTRKTGSAYSVQRNVSLDKNPAQSKKTVFTYKKHMSSCDDIRSVSAAFAQPALQQPNKTGRCGLGSATDGEAQAQSSTSPALQLQGRSSTSLLHSTLFAIIPLCHICTRWHLKNHQLLMEIVKCRSGRICCSVLFHTLLTGRGKIIHAAGSWSDSCLGIFLIIRSRAITALKKDHLKQRLDCCTGHRWNYTVTTHF